MSLMRAAAAASAAAGQGSTDPGTPGGLIFGDEFEGANQYPYASQDMNASHPTWYIEPYSGGDRSDPWNRVNGRAVKPLGNRFHRAWSQQPIGGPGQDLRIDILLRITTLQSSSGIENGVKFMAKWPKLAYLGSSDPSTARGGDPQPGSFYAFLATAGYKEISKRGWQEPYVHFTSTSKPTLIGQDVHYVVTMEWLSSPRRIRVRVWDDGTTAGTPVLEAVDNDPGQGDPSGVGMWRAPFVGLRADGCAFEMDYYRVSALHGGPPPAQEPIDVAPVALSGTAVSATQIDWSHAEVPGATSYDRELVIDDGAPVVTTGHSALAFSDTGLAPESVVRRRVAARNGLGRGPWSAPVEVSTLTAPDPGGGDDGQVYLSWSDDFDDGLDPAAWATSDGPVSAQNGQMMVSPGGSVRSVTENFTGKATSFCLVSAPDVPETQYLYSVEQDPQNAYEWLVYQGSLRARRWVNGSISTLLNVPLSDEQCFRIREDSGDVILETWDGATWTQRYSEPNQLDLTNANVRVWNYGGTIGEFVIDNVNLPPATGGDGGGDTSGGGGLFSRLHVEGNRMVNEDGQIVVLRGVNMMRREWDNNLNWERVAVPALATQWKGNVVHTGFASDPVNSGDATYLGNLDELVQVCEDSRVWLVLSFRSYARNTSMPVGIPDSRAEQALGALAARYKERGHVMFGAQVETNLHTYPGTWAECLPYYTRCVDAVRTAAAPHEPIVMSSGPAWGRMINGAVTAPIPRDNVVYKTHPYGAQESFRGWFLDAVDAGLPVWVGECGATHDSTHGYEDDQLALLQICRENGIGWAAWVFDDVGGPILAAPRSAFQPNAVGQKFYNELQAAAPPPPAPDEPDEPGEPLAGYALPQGTYDPADYAVRSANIDVDGDEAQLLVSSSELSEFVSQDQDLTGKAIYMRDVDCPTAATTDTQYLHTWRSAGDTSMVAEFMVYNDTLRGRSNLNFQLFSVAYDPVAHAHRQIRHDAVTDEFVWETSADGLTWTERHREDAHFDVSSSHWRLWVWNTNAANNGARWTVADLNSPPQP